MTSTISTASAAAPTTSPVRPGPPSTGSRVRWVVVALSCLAVVGYVVAIYTQGSLATLSKTGAGLSTTYAHRPTIIQGAFYAHISFSALALLLGPAQFSATIRRTRPRLHRWTGRVFLTAVGIGSVAAFVMSFVSSVAFAGFFGFGTLAVLWGYTAWRGYAAIRARDIANHQAWMIRCFALTYAGVTLRSWFGALIGVQLLFAHHPLDATHVLDTAYAALPFLSWLPNLVIAELLIRRRGLPGLTLTPSPTAPSPTHQTPAARGV